MPVLLIVLYAVLVHLSVVRHAPLLQWLALIVLCLLPLHRSLLAGRMLAWTLLLLLAAGLYGLTYLGGGIYALFLPPVVLPAMLLAVFATTLRPGRTPLVTRMAMLSRGGSLPAELVPYTRAVTWFWVAVLAAQTLAALLLAWLAPLELWSAYTNFGAYAVLALAFASEYLVRRLRYSHLPHQTVIEYLRSLVHTNYRTL